MKLFGKKPAKKTLRKQNEAQRLSNLYRGYNNGESGCCSASQSSNCYSNGTANCCNGR